MAAKSQPVPQDNTGSFVLSQTPPSISLASSVLASVISLPQNPLIVYSVFTCLSATLDRLEQLELARKTVLLQNKSRAFVNSLLPVVHITKDAPTLYVFALGSTARPSEAHDTLSRLEIEALVSTESSSFTPAAIYPCSVACSTQLSPCERCLDPTLTANPALPAQLLPRSPLRLPLTLFLQAARDRLIDDIAEASKLHPRGRSVTRLKGGFLLGPIPAASEWGSGWENYPASRPLISCTLQVHVSFSAHTPWDARLVIHPVMRPTYYLPLRPSLPLPAGTPIVLLPHGVPAYYLNIYSGPAAALTTQFEDALLGLGAGDWKRITHAGSYELANPLDNPSYIIAWLAVQNKQGEDKGMPVIWPATLCVSYQASSPSAHARTTLPYIPELPSQLQASPPPPAPVVPATLSFTMAATPTDDTPASATTASSHAPPPWADRGRLSSSFQRRPSLLRSSPTSDSLRAFRTLSLAKKPYIRDVKKVAAEVGVYVDAVVKERERERERIRRDRQEQDIASARAKLASVNPQPAVESPAPTVSNPEVHAPPTEEVAPPIPEVPLSPAAELTEPEPQLTAESDHSGDSLFSPPDAPIDLPSEEEPQSALEQPDGDVPAVPTEAPADVAPPAEAEVGPPSMPFDSFNGFDGSWGQQTNGYMDMTIDYELDFNMHLGLGGARTGAAGAGSFEMDEGFEAFTEDDFDYFDAPSAQRSVPQPVVPPVTAFTTTVPSANGAASLGLTPLVTVAGSPSISGPGPPSASIAVPPPWTAHLGEPFTPKPSADLAMLDGIAPPELLPPSPTKTPSSHSAPATPSVHLSDAYRPATLGLSIFDPIPFASSHREADGKYAIGKFALPSPPVDKDPIEPLAAAPTILPGWKSKYSAVTDPRIGVVRKLIGVKRKSLDQGARINRKVPVWESYREPEEWQSSSPPSATPDSEESDDELWVEDEETVLAPRPSTPPPSYLPLGPALLRTHFHHAHLLPMCTPLRPPGMAVNATPGNTAQISVPTPVSPAAILGAASEKSKSLEAAAQILVKEVVENPIWSEAWRENASLSATPPVLPAQVWQADARYISHLVDSNASKGSIPIQTLFGGASSADTSEVILRSLDAPMLTIGKGDSVIQLSPTSLRFWEKLGLSPRSGPKDVTAFVFFEENKDEEREAAIENWLAKISTAYFAKNFGSHVAGSSSVFTKAGLAPIRFDALRKTLSGFVQEITTRNPHLVFYIVTPSHIISSSSPVLRQILSAVRRFYKQHSQGDILVHFVPESLIFGTHIHPASSLSGLDAFVCSVYDRLLQPVTRAMSRKLFAYGPPVVGNFEAPAYALVSLPAGKSRSVTLHPRISFSLESSASSLDVTRRHTLLHVGYQVSTCGRWILATCIDAEGEAHELKAWLTPDDNVEEFVVNQVWSFVHEFARRANVEWRIVVSKLGLMSHSEANAWVSYLESVVALTEAPLHVTLLAVDTENPWTFLSPTKMGSFNILKRNPSSGSQGSSSKSSSRHSHTTFTDAAFTTYALTASPGLTLYPAYTAERAAKCPTVAIPGTTEFPFIPDTDDDDGSGTPLQSPAVEPMRAPSWNVVMCAQSSTDHTSVSTTQIFQIHVARSPRSTYGAPSATDSDSASREVPAEHMPDIVRNFSELAVLSRARWKLHAGPSLPFHLAALEVMRAALSMGAVDP